MLDVPVLPSVVAVIVADPAPTPVTSPVALTVATPLLLLVHVTTRPARALPLASRGVAMSCSVPLASPLFPSLVAVIAAEPAVIPVTLPFASTLAVPLALLDQVIDGPESGVPFESCGVASSCSTPPTITVPDCGVTTTVATEAAGLVATGRSHAPATTAASS